MAPDPGLSPEKCTESMSYKTASWFKFKYDGKGIDQSVVKEETRIGVSDMRHISLWEVGPFRTGFPPASQK